MSSANLVAKEAELSTIDVEALNDLRREVFPISPAPLSSAVPHSLVVESPVSLSPVVPHSPVVESTGLVSEELIRNCVTPRKVKKVQDTLQAEHDRNRCAVKLLPHFISKEELTTRNTDGTHNKDPLDHTRLHSLKGYNLKETGFTFNPLIADTSIKGQCEHNYMCISILRAPTLIYDYFVFQYCCSPSSLSVLMRMKTDVGVS